MAGEMTYNGMTENRIKEFFGSSIEMSKEDIAHFHEQRLEVLDELVQPLVERRDALKEEIKSIMIEKGKELLTLEQLIKVMYKEYGASEGTMMELRGAFESKESA